MLLAIIITSVALGLFLRYGYQQFLHLQAQNIQGLSVFEQIILPLAGLVIVCQLVLASLAATFVFPLLSSCGYASLFYQASINRLKLINQSAISIAVFGFIPLGIFCLMCWLLASLTPIDSGRMLATIFGLIIIQLISVMLILAITFSSQKILFSLIKIFIIFSLIILVESLARIYAIETYWRGLFLPFYNFRSGLLVYADLVNYLAWLMIAFATCYLTLTSKLNVAKGKYKIMLVAGGVLIFVCGFIPGYQDMTRSKQNSYAYSLTEQLNKHDQTLQVVAVIDKDTNRDKIFEGFKFLKNAYANSSLAFHSRQSLGPDMQHAGEFVQFTLGNMRQSVAYPFKQNANQVFQSAIQQMLMRKNQWITFIEGHGEASLFATKASDLTQLHASIKQMGWPVAALNLAQTPLITDNTSLLIIASSKTQWLPAEIDLVINYLQQGKNLLLMHDPDSTTPAEILDYIGIKPYAGTLIDRQGYESGTPHPGIVIVKQMSAHPSVSQINSLLAFPWASGLQWDKQNLADNLKFETILQTHASVWNELQAEQQQLFYNPEAGEVRQSFMLAAATINLTNQQKIVMIGDSHFASDSAINNYANRQFMLNLLSWLTETQMQQIAQSNRDSYLKPSKWGYFAANWFFCLLLPLLIVLFWWAVYWRFVRK